MENKFCDLSNQIAIITGASSGIGAASAKILAKQGAKVALAARREDKLNQVAKEITDFGGEVLTVCTDVSHKDQVEAMVSQTVGKWGKVDILLNNAGIAHFASFLEMTEDQWNETLDINLKGQFLVAQAAAKEMIKNHYGRIINIASVAAGQIGIGFPSIAHYCASKGGVVAMTEALTTELTPQGINVNAIAPGLISTEMTVQIESDPSTLQGMIKRVPKGRAGKPEEIANVVVFLASKESEYVSGALWVVDGGWLAE
ncbi:SDR family oxidoreductase [Candidatus Microgenomates bacterium]|nr:SDR family oxidoreductase [Candidatus Microgenomates bacterium]